MNDLINRTAIDSALVELSSKDTPDERREELVNTFKAVQELARETRRRFDDSILSLIEDVGPVTIGFVRYYAGDKRETKCTRVRDTLECLFVVHGGDFERVAEAFTSQPFKAGHCRGVLPAMEYEQLFTTETKLELREGVPNKSLIAVDERFAS